MKPPKYTEANVALIEAAPKYAATAGWVGKETTVPTGTRVPPSRMRPFRARLVPPALKTPGKISTRFVAGMVM
jgi:hypothetical protein